MNDKIVLGDGIARQELNVIFVIDNSGSMDGEKIGAVNNAIRDVMSIMPEIQDDTSDAMIKISALIPQMVDNFKWRDISCEAGTDYTKAYTELSKFLVKKSNGGQMPDLGGIAPIIIMMTDGMPTSYDWEDTLSLLKKKGWFKVALKYALAIQIDTAEAMSVLKKFTGNSETVLKVYSAEALRKVIKVIAVTASKIKSSSSSSSGGMVSNNNEMAQAEITEELSTMDDIEW